MFPTLNILSVSDKILHKQISPIICSVCGVDDDGRIYEMLLVLTAVLCFDSHYRQLCDKFWIISTVVDSCYGKSPIFSHSRKVAKSACWLRHVCHSVCLSAQGSLRGVWRTSLTRNQVVWFKGSLSIWFQFGKFKE